MVPLMGALHQLPHPLVGHRAHPLMRAAVTSPRGFLAWFYALGGSEDTWVRQRMESTYPDEAKRAQAAALMLINAGHPTVPSWLEDR